MTYKNRLNSLISNIMLVSIILNYFPENKKATNIFSSINFFKYLTCIQTYLRRITQFQNRIIYNIYNPKTLF